MVVFALVTALLASHLAEVQAPVPGSGPQQAPAPVTLEDVQVTGRPLDTMIRDFVDKVAAPNPSHGLARWQDSICVGVANLKAEAAHYVADRVSTVAADVGLRPGGPGCEPNVVIIATGDSAGLTEQLVEENTRSFRLGGDGMDQGGSAFAAFEHSDAPVRWWQVAMPINSETGERAARLPGDCQTPCAHATDYAPKIAVFAASRMNTQIVDSLIRTIIVVDVNRMSNVSVVQLADYLSMVTLAQIDPSADASRYASILNLFNTPDPAAGLTDWDTAYLRGLYHAERNRSSLRSSRLEIVNSIHRAHRDLQATRVDDPS